MEYLAGLLLAVGVLATAAALGVDRDRSFFPVVLDVSGTYYVLFGVMATSGHPIGPEIAVAGSLIAVAAIAFKRNLWLVVAGAVGHGAFDLVHHRLIDNAGV